MAYITINNTLTYDEAVKRVEEALETHLIPRAYAQRGIKGAAQWLYGKNAISGAVYAAIFADVIINK